MFNSKDISNLDTDLYSDTAIFKTGNRESENWGTGNGERGTGNGERGTGNGESLKRGIFKSGESLKAGIFKSGNL